jgi:hypothetical protein
MGDLAMIAAPLTMQAAAAALGVSRRWLQDFLKSIPPCHLQAGHKKLFDEAALAAVREAMREKARETCHLPSSPRRRDDRRIGASAGPSSATILTEARRLASAGSRKSSSPNGEPKRNVVPFPGRP